MKLKKILMSIGVLLLIAATVLLYIYQNNNNYVLKINGEKVSVGEFGTYLKLQKKIMQPETASDNYWNELIDGVPAIEVARENTKKSITDTKVKMQEASKRKIKLSYKEKQELSSLIQSSGQEAMKLYELTFDEMFKINEEAFILDKLSSAIFKETDHTGHTHGNVDIDAYINRTEPLTLSYNARHVLLSFPEGADDAKKEEIRLKAVSILDRIKAGESFETLAAEFNEDPGSKETNGLYEKVTKGQFVSEFESAALSLNEGELYPEPVKTDYGYHIIKLEKLENKESTFVSSSEASSIIAEEFGEISKSWIDNADVKVNQEQYNLAK